MKVSQCINSSGGTDAFAVIYSSLDTAKKNGMSPDAALEAVRPYDSDVPEELLKSWHHKIKIKSLEIILNLLQSNNPRQKNFTFFLNLIIFIRISTYCI